MHADKCLEFLHKDDLRSNGGSKESLIARAKAVKGLVELVTGDLESGKVKTWPKFWFIFLLSP